MAKQTFHQGKGNTKLTAFTLTYQDGETLDSLKICNLPYKQNDREEIRRKLAMEFDEDEDEYNSFSKTSFQSRLQSGMKLQICFMNETASDCESQCSDTESTQNGVESVQNVSKSKTASASPDKTSETLSFNEKQELLQAEAKVALQQAKEMARMQMELEKQYRKKTPIADVVKDSLTKIGIMLPEGKRRLSRQILTDMNIAQLQIIINDLHNQIEILNEELVKLLLERDDLHMEQDSMLVDVEDLNKHLGAKEVTKGQNCILPQDSSIQHL